MIRFGFRYEKETNCPYKQKSLNVSTPFVLMTRLSLPLSKLIVDGDDNSFFSQGTLCSSLCSSAPKWWPSTMSELSLGIRTSVRRDLESSLSRYKKKWRFCGLCDVIRIFPTVAQKGHTCKLKMLLQTKNFTCKLKMLQQIKNRTCKLKIVHAN